MKKPSKKVLALHESLVQAALDAIYQVHGDNSVSLEKTLESIESLGDEIDVIMDLLKDDIKRRDSTK